MIASLFSFALPLNAEVMHGVSIFGDLKYPANFDHFDYANPDAPQDGEIHLSGIGSFDSLNPYIVKGSSDPYFSSFCLASLFTSSADEPSSYYGYVAKGIKIASDFSSVTFYLNPEAEFNNRKKIKADDVIFSFNILKTKGIPLFRTYYANVTNVERISDHEVKFSLEKSTNRELPVILGQLPIFSKTYYETHKFEESSLEPCPCSGPYEVDTIDSGRSIVYRKVKNWWGAKLPSKKGLYNFEKIKIDYYRDTNAMFEAFKAGKTDLRMENSSKLWVTSYDFPAIKQGFVKKAIVSYEMARTYGLFFNTRKNIFSNRLVREALTNAFDFNWANKNLFYGRYKRSKSYFAPSTFEAKGLPEGEELKLLEPFKDKLPKEVFTKIFDLPDDSKENDVRKSIQKSLELLEQAGWVIKDQTLIFKKDGTPFVFEILIHDPATERIALHYLNSLKKLGIKVNIRSIDTTSYQQRVETKDYDMILSVIPQSETPGNEQRSFWGSKTADLPGSSNFAGIKDPVVDQLIELVINSTSYEELQIRTRALDRVLLWGYYMVPGWHSNGTPIAYWDRFGKPEIEPKFASMPFTTWWIDKGKEAKLPDHLKRNVDALTPQKTSENFFQRLYNHIIHIFKKIK